MRVNKNTYEFDAIGTHWWCEALDDSSVFTADIINGITQICDEFDRRYSRFKEDSLVGKLYGTGELLDAPEEMRRMLSFAHELYDVTEGVFDIGVGATLHGLGYGSRKYAGTSPKNIWHEISYTTKKISAPQGVMLDFGGQGKGWLIDRIVELLRSEGFQQFIVNGGGDMYIASKEPIKIALEDPEKPGKYWGEALLMNEALAGSSTTKRTWTHNGMRHHHIIDPVLQSAAESGVKGTFVKASTATVADALATVLIVRPQLREKLEGYYGVQTIVIN